MENDLKKMIGENETILYKGKPDKKCFILESIFNPMLPFALIWGIIDFGVIGLSFMSDAPGEMALFIIPFMLFHLMPVWLYLGGVLFSFIKYRNTNYIVTDNGVYVSGGIFSKTFNTKPFAELSHVDLHRGIFDQLCGVGDIILTTSHLSSENNSATITIADVSDYMKVYNLVSTLQKDIYTDVMYPNDMRPNENHGYNTKYKG